MPTIIGKDKLIATLNLWIVPVDPLKLSEALGIPRVVDRLADPLLAKFEPAEEESDG